MNKKEILQDLDLIINTLENFCNNGCDTIKGFESMCEDYHVFASVNRLSEIKEILEKNL